MDIAVIGLGHAFCKQYDALESIKDFDVKELCDTDIDKIKKYNCISNYMELDENLVIVATGPRKHLKIIDDLITSDKKVIVEKPVVVNSMELNKLKEIINKDNYYNALHFAYGLEIDYYMRYRHNKPNKIKIYISDNYVNNNHIKEDVRGLCGSYLDEVINPLSACCRLYGYDLKFINVVKKKYEEDSDDYYSYSKFMIDKITVDVEVLWDDKESQKYIDLYYEDKVIRLDSMKQSVIDLTNNKVLFTGTGDRMTNHYIGVYKDYLKRKSNIEESVKLHEELLKGI